ncbi:ketopantoate reductase family protein [Haloplanus halobius]|uniref:ketopantoate reductase family protein n=1 Tax=Haloplanus halobius TaxID=2934938 RepID=UPI00200DAD66|nr:2-dehydropantoate 2-reductase [Haloplanus sp. XH21]
MVSVAVYGAGGIGGYFGGRLAQGGADVSLIARGEHLDAMQQQGLHVESIHGDFSVAPFVTNDPEAIGPVDYVLVTVKSYDTGDVAAALSPLLHDDTAVISLQNGVENEKVLANEIGKDHVLGGVAYIFSTLSEPGVVTHSSGPARLIFGELDGTRSDRAQRFLDLCEQSEIEAELSTEIRKNLWTKFAFICAQAGMTATARCPIGQIRNTPESWAMYERLLREVITVANATGVELSDEVADRWLSFATELDPDSYSSLHHDLVHGNRTELEAFQGTVVDYADQQDVAVPATEAVYAVLKPQHDRNLSKS